MYSLGTGEGRDRDESEIGLGVVSDGLQECRELFNDLVISIEGTNGLLGQQLHGLLYIQVRHRLT